MDFFFFFLTHAPSPFLFSLSSNLTLSPLGPGGPDAPGSPFCPVIPGEPLAPGVPTSTESADSP